MSDNVTAVDKILANESYLMNMRVARDAVGTGGMLKIVMLRLGLVGKIKVKAKGIETEVTKENFVDFWRNEAIEANYKNDKLQRVGDEIHFDYSGRTVIFKTDPSSKRVTNQTVNLINEQFFTDQYGKEGFVGKVVVDIGANIGDSPIYFALNGASKVYGYEPFPYAYEMALKNIKANKLEGKIVMHNEGVAGEEGKLTIGEGYETDTGAVLKDYGKGKEVKLVTLKSIVDRYKIKNGFLKSDCEGSEYGIILKADDETLRAFDTMAIEYHKGYIDIRKRIESLGYSITMTRPMKMLHADSKEFSYAGLLFAKKR